MIDIPLDVANERGTWDHRDRFESADLAFHQRVRDGYLAMADADRDHWFVVDGTRDFDELAEVVDVRLNSLPWSNA